MTRALYTKLVDLVGIRRTTVPDDLVVVEAEEFRRWSDSDRESAFFLWRTTAGRNLSLVSRVLNIPYGTLDDWKRRDGWVQRANEEDRESRAMLGDAVQAAILNNVLPSIMVAVEIRDNRQASAKDRLEAAKWLAGVAGIVPAQRSELEIRAKRNQAEARKFESMSDEEFKERLRQYVEDNGELPDAGDEDA